MSGIIIFVVQEKFGAANAEVAELADAHGSGPCGSNTLRVRLPSSAGDEQEVRKLASCFCFPDILEKINGKLLFGIIKKGGGTADAGAKTSLL